MSHYIFGKESDKVKSKKGFTLIELVITIAILGIVLPMIFSPIIFSFTNFQTQNEKTKITSDARAAMDYLTREIRKSNHVTVTGNIIETDRGIYKIEGRNLMQGDKIIREGIDELITNKTGQTIEIEIVIKDSKDNGHNLSSIIHVR